MVYERTPDGLRLESAAFGGGRIQVAHGSFGETYTPNYFLTDHLGSTRVILDGTYDPQRSDYHAFGLRWASAGGRATTNRYLYNGKELQEIGGINYLDYGARMYDPVTGRWNGVDPLMEKYYSTSPYAFCMSNPVLFIDLNGMDIFIFDLESGMYMNQKVQAEGPHRMAAKSVGKDGYIRYRFYDFNDPEVDAKAIDNGEITQFEIMSDSKVSDIISESGVQTQLAQSNKWSYAWNESVGKMDYGVNNINSEKLKKDTFYIREEIAYNVGDIGNYLWGRGMAELGFSLLMSQLGAHGNNMLNGRRQNSYHYNFGPGTYGTSSLFDSKADQMAIRRGYMSSPQWQRQQKLLLEQTKIRMSLHPIL